MSHGQRLSTGAVLPSVRSAIFVLREVNPYEYVETPAREARIRSSTTAIEDLRGLGSGEPRLETFRGVSGFALPFAYCEGRSQLVGGFARSYLRRRRFVVRPLSGVRLPRSGNSGRTHSAG